MKGIIPSPSTMKYRVKYALWYVEAHSLEEARRKALEMLKGSLQNLVSVEPLEPKGSVFMRLLTGK